MQKQQMLDQQQSADSNINPFTGTENDPSQQEVQQ